MQSCLQCAFCSFNFVNEVFDQLGQREHSNGLHQLSLDDTFNRVGHCELAERLQQHLVFQSGSAVLSIAMVAFLVAHVLMVVIETGLEEVKRTK